MPSSPFNHVDTTICADCGHVRHRHVFHPAIRGCMVPACSCAAEAPFLQAQGPQIEETNNFGGTNIKVPQPAPPHAAWRDK
jgi:hypothetical protein